MTLKLSNSYANAFGRLYARTPKAVFAAVAYSFANYACGHEAKTTEECVDRFVEEWRILSENGIVPQFPPREFLKSGFEPSDDCRPNGDPILCGAEWREDRSDEFAETQCCVLAQRHPGQHKTRTGRTF